MAQLALAILVLAVLLTFAVLARRAGQTRASWAFIALAGLISAAFSYVGWRTWQAPPQLDPAQVVIELINQCAGRLPAILHLGTHHQ